MRLFVAIRPPEQVLDHLAGALSAIEPPPGDDGPPPLRWTPPEQRHITLAFYGDVPDGVVDDLAAGLDAVAAAIEPFDVRLVGAGSFLGRTLWAGVSQVAPSGGRELIDLMAQCEELGAPWQHPARQRRRAHLTLARLSARAGARRGQLTRPGRGRAARVRAGQGREFDIDQIVHALSIYRGPQWQAHDLELVASYLGEGRGGGAHHEVMARVPLGAEQGGNSAVAR